MFHVTNEILGSWLHAIYVQHTVNINNIEHSTAAAELGQQFDFAQHRVYDPFTLFLYKQCANGFFFLFLFAPILDCSRLALCLMSIMEKKKTAKIFKARCTYENGNGKIVRANGRIFPVQEPENWT